GAGRAAVRADRPGGGRADGASAVHHGRAGGAMTTDPEGARTLERGWWVPRPFGRPVPLALVAWLALIWVMLWGELSVGTVLGGLAAGAVVTWLLPLPALDPGIRLRPLPFLRFLFWFLLDLVTSTARVVYWVLRTPSPPTAIVPVRLRTSSESMTVMIMIAVTTVPGSVVLRAHRERKELIIHVLGRTGT